MNKVIELVLNQEYYPIDRELPFKVTPQALVVLEKSYLYGETPEEMLWRVANAVAKPLEGLLSNVELSAVRFVFYNMMASQDFMPNTPTLTNAGRPLNQMAACFVVPVGDSMHSIFAEAIPAMAMIQRTGGGTGFDFSPLRPEGTEVTSTKGQSSGPISFMHAFDACSQTIKQGGVRRGANMGVLRVDHPDILKFIHAKDEKDVLSNFNLSVGITDEFMGAVEKDQQYCLIHDGRVYGTISAREVWDELCQCAWEKGEPGILFLDEINRKNTLPGLGPICATNPCLVGDTLIKTVEGMIPIKDLVGKEIDVYCVDDKYNLTISKAKDIRLTQKQAKLVEVATTKGTVVCTPDHRFYTRNRGYVEAKDLTARDKLVALNVAPKNQKYVKVYLTGTSAQVPAEHIFIAQHYYPDITGKDTHHLDNNPKHNVFSNIEVLGHGDHSRLSNLGHPDWMEHDPTTGQWIPNIREPKDWSNKLGVHPVGTNMRLLSVTPLEYTEDVYDMEVEDHHNFFANYVLVHNCGEQPLLPNEACNLASINLVSCFVDKETFSWKKLDVISKLGALFLDCVVDAGTYPLPEIDEMVKSNRKIGLGVMGFADLCFKMRVPYTSNEANLAGLKIMKQITASSHMMSEWLGEWLGLFPNWDKSIFAESGTSMRNASTTTIAPTGTIALIANTSYGMEPVYALSYTKKLASSGEELDFLNVYLQEFMDECKFEDDLQLSIRQYVTTHGSLQGYPTYGSLRYDDLETMKEVFVTALDIEANDHVRVQAAFQTHTDNAVSKTINFDESVTVAQIAESLRMAYDLECKGVTVYRTGCRDEQPMQIGKQIKGKEGNTLETVVTIEKKVRPKCLSGSTDQVDSGCGMMLVTVNKDEYGNIFEVLMKAGSTGGCAAFTDSTARLISIGLRYGVPLEVIIDQLCSVKCDNYRFQVGKNGVLKGKSCSDAVGRLLREKMQAPRTVDDLATEEVEKIMIQAANNVLAAQKDTLTWGDPITPDSITGICPACGVRLQRVEGCLACSCGYSKC